MAAAKRKTPEVKAEDAQMPPPPVPKKRKAAGGAKAKAAPSQPTSKKLKVGGAAPSAGSPSQLALGFHVVFMIDTSRSMIRSDVASQQGSAMSRIQAVWEALASFAGLLAELPDLTCSLVLFNTQATVALDSVPMGGASGLQSHLQDIQENTTPKWGGDYLPPLRALQSQALARTRGGGVSIGVLLTDGRPGDSPQKAVKLVEALRKDSGSRCLLHTVMFGPTDKGAEKILKNLADVGGGSFHANVKLDASALQLTFCRLSASVSTLRGTVLEFGEAALRPLPQRPREAEDLWQTASREELLQRKVCREVTGYIMLPAPGGSELDLEPRGEKRTAFLHEKPFGEGALRWAFHLWWTVPAKEKTRCWHLVVKESKFEGAHDSAQKVHGLFLKTHRRAQALAKDFDAELELAGRGDVKVSFTPAYVIQLSDPQKGGGLRYVTAERYIPGPYTKFNANDGYVNLLTAKDPAGQTAAAFSHFTFARSGGEEICVDIQGVGLDWTDPQLHSRKREYGAGDLGVEGMKLFFRTHKCNELCDALHLRSVGVDSFGQSAQSSSQPQRSGDAQEEQRQCLLCMDAERTIVCRPCGHLCICTNCYKQNPPATCPVCRHAVASVLQLSVNAMGMHHSTYYERPVK